MPKDPPTVDGSMSAAFAAPPAASQVRAKAAQFDHGGAPAFRGSITSAAAHLASTAAPRGTSPVRPNQLQAAGSPGPTQPPLRS